MGVNCLFSVGTVSQQRYNFPPMMSSNDKLQRELPLTKKNNAGIKRMDNEAVTLQIVQ